MGLEKGTYSPIEGFEKITRSIGVELSNVIVGQEELIHHVLVVLFAGGNALLEGVPGLGKTLLIRTLAKALNCSFNRIQFTPDLMPADIVGTMIISEDESGRRDFRFEKGPVFANLVLADEINRAAPRTQSALLEAMEERNVTVGRTTHDLPRPFYVLATQNPIEMEGTYPLPEAQLDRFLYKIHVPFPTEVQMVEIAKRTTSRNTPTTQRVVDGRKISSLQEMVRSVPVEERVYEYGARITRLTHPDNPNAPDPVARYVRIGASPRGLQAIILGGKVEALMDGRKAVSIEDVQKVTYPALRHRVILNFEAQAQGIAPDSILDEILQTARIP